MAVFENRLRLRLQQGEKTAGAWLQIASPLTAEILGSAGFDWLMIDLEHGHGDLKILLAQLQAMNGTNAVPLARAPWNDVVAIKRILDAGVAGVLVPYVNSQQEAEAVVRACCYPPAGIRGVAGSPRAVGYGHNIRHYLDRANREVFILVAVETRMALTNLDEILNVERIDAIFVGPMDLAASMGHLSEPDNEEVQNAIIVIEEKVLRAGKVLASTASNWERARRLYDRGYQMVMLMADGVALSTMAHKIMNNFKSTYSR